MRMQIINLRLMSRVADPSYGLLLANADYLLDCELAMNLHGSIGGLSAQPVSPILGPINIIAA